MSKFIVKKLNNCHEQQIKDFYINQPTKGNYHFYLQREPSFFSALEVEGFDNEVIAVIDTTQDEIACAAIKSKRLCYINKKPLQLGYLSGLRLAENYKSGIALVKLLRYLKDILLIENCEFYFCSIFDDNIHAINVLTSSKAGIPLFKKYAQLNTIIFKPSVIKPTKNRNYEIRRATKDDIPQIVRFLNQEGQNYQLFPVYSTNDFQSDFGMLSNLEITDVAIYLKDKEIAGTMALWNQKKFRQWKIIHYSKSFKIIKPLINISASVLGKPKFPKEGKTVDYVTLSLICIKNFDKNVFINLIKYLTNNISQQTYLLLGLFDNNPLIQNINFPVVRLKSHIYTVSCEESNRLFQLHQNIPHLELGSL